MRLRSVGMNGTAGHTRHSRAGVQDHAGRDAAPPGGARSATLAGRAAATARGGRIGGRSRARGIRYGVSGRRCGFPAGGRRRSGVARDVLHQAVAAQLLRVEPRRWKGPTLRMHQILISQEGLDRLHHRVIVRHDRRSGQEAASDVLRSPVINAAGRRQVKASRSSARRVMRFRRKLSESSLDAITSTPMRSKIWA